jgi:sigma-B regulation protein RsbQ
VSLLAVDSAAHVLRRNNVRVVGNPHGPTLMLSHGFGCGQDSWRDLVPYLESDYRIVLYDLVGAGSSQLDAYDPGRYDSLHGYAEDVLQILDALDASAVTFVGHSVSSIIGVLASNRDSSRFKSLVLVGPSPRYVNDGDYVGGFEQADIDLLLDTLDANYLGWSATMAPIIMGNADRPELGESLTESFCRVDPAIARHFAHVTFLSDNRRDLAQVTLPTLVIQTVDDVIAPMAVGEYVHSQIAGSEFVLIDARGHVPSLSEPATLARVIRDFLQ